VKLADALAATSFDPTKTTLFTAGARAHRQAAAESWQAGAAGCSWLGVNAASAVASQDRDIQE
jgi:hypothetical protein